MTKFELYCLLLLSVLSMCCLGILIQMVPHGSTSKLLVFISGICTAFSLGTFIRLVYFGEDHER